MVKTVKDKRDWKKKCHEQLQFTVAEQNKKTVYCIKKSEIKQTILMR